MRIAMADDHPVTLLGLRTVLQKHLDDIEAILDAATGRKLLDVLGEHDCNLCITDFFMPLGNNSLGLGGLNLLRTLHRHFPSLPVIVWTTVQNSALIRGMFVEGAYAVVDKAATPVDMVRAVQAVKSGRRFVSKSLRGALVAVDHATNHIPEALLIAPQLSTCEAEILCWLTRGWIVSDIARHTNRSVKTVSQHKHNAMRKLGVTCDYALFEYILAGGQLGVPSLQRRSLDSPSTPYSQIA